MTSSHYKSDAIAQKCKAEIIKSKDTTASQCPPSSNPIFFTDTKVDLTLPREIQDIILDLKGGDDYSNAQYKPPVNQSTLVNRPCTLFGTQLGVLALLQHVVRGEKDQAEVMIKNNPQLLLIRGTVIDFSGRKIEGTAYQLALGAHDVNRVKPSDTPGEFKIVHENEGMAEMIQRYFIRACRNDEKKAHQIIQQQQEEQFPGGYHVYQTSKEVQAKRSDDVYALRKVMSAIAEAKVDFLGGHYDYSHDGEVIVDAKCEAALNKFREYLRPKETIRHGEHFNLHLLAKALKLYDEFDSAHPDRHTYYKPTSHNPKKILIWRKVIGYIQRFLPACYAQVFCQSIHDVADSNKKLIRSLKFGNDTVNYYPLDAKNDSGLGYEYAAGMLRWRECMSSRANATLQSLLHLIFSKNDSLSRIRLPHSDNHPKENKSCRI